MYPQLAYYYKHRTYKLEYQKQYYRDNKEYITQYYKKYYNKKKDYINNSRNEKKSKSKIKQYYLRNPYLKPLEDNPKKKTKKQIEEALTVRFD
jgi:DNA polymerase I-like protein with 3'-5' exonuclease and polymerase domains